ncbi:serine carboxypeptidase-like 20 isoform X2 [Macadamia integrifolia]|uniref:serine carboxypeptidase-like 20 isoform X2 n=1 Tax=Macadamia integrifolia TaxID=60698 RepID=UPI001C4F5824|nr:serine carboxypeptidase-like 20 isoform X2 [Macadamia integrifolia]
MDAAEQKSSFCYIFAVIGAAPESALVTHLPGFNGTFPSKHYSGYITVDESHERKLFYYFVTSERNLSKDPVVLWLNGGPGCSSMDGFVYEHGPFNFQKANKPGALPRLHLNPHSWSKVSNIIYLDSPAGVGFSYSNFKEDYRTGDLKTASDSHSFLLKWFEQYPEFLSNPFYLAGESFAGVYVPTLASEVAKGIRDGLKPFLNFKGYMIGNAVTDEVIDGNAFVPFAHGMGLISDDLYEETVKTCKGNYSSPYYGACGDLLLKINDDIMDLNIYDILEPCNHNPAAGKIADGNIKLPDSFKHLGETERPLAVRKRMFGRAWPYGAPVRDGLVLTWPQILNGVNVPCTDASVATEWLNNATVRKAIHAEQVSVIGAWALCVDLIYIHDAGSMIKYHKKLTALGYRALIYSGDHDMCVPYTGSEVWTRSLGYKIIDEWRPWYCNEQVAGYTQGYAKNLTFLTIKGSGHTVPEYKPVEALAFYSRWLEGQKI